jgi:hypothetical protein
MTALARKILGEEKTLITRTPAKLYVVANNATVAPEVEGGALKNIALFFAAPFFGLAYIIAFPIVGLVALAVLTARAAAKYEAVRATAALVRTAGLAAAVPMLGLGYIILFPFIGLAALAWMGGRAAVGGTAR